MKTGMIVQGIGIADAWYSWEEIYKLCGLVQEDFLHDTSGECYAELVQAIKVENK